MTRASTVPGLLRARDAEMPGRELLELEGASATYGDVEEPSNLRTDDHASTGPDTLDARQESRS